MKQLYVCSKPILSKDGNLHRHLLGTLSQLDDGTYRFEYDLDDSPESFGLLLPIFPEKDKIYNDAETRVLLDDYLPSENDTAFISEILKKSDLSEYDEWTWLQTFDSDDSDSETCLYETLPDDVIRHDTSDESINDDFDFGNFDIDDFKEEPPEEELEEPEEELEENFDDLDIFEDEDDENNDDLSEFDDFPDLEDDPLGYLDDADYDVLDDLFAPTEQNTVQAVQAEPTVPAVSITPPITEPVKPETPKKPTVTIIKTVYKKKKRAIANDDFIEPPPESPIDIMQKKFLEGQRQRQTALAEQLKNNPYNTKR